MRGKVIRVDENGCIACRQCGVVAPLDTFPVDNSKRLGHRNICAHCKRIAAKESNWYLAKCEEWQRNREERSARKAEKEATAAAARAAMGPHPKKHTIILGKKFCSGCGEWLSVYCFRRDADTATGIAYRCNACRAEKLARDAASNKAYKLAHAEQARQQDRDRLARMTPEQRAARQQYRHEWYECNRDRMREWRHQHHEVLKQRQKQWRKSAAGKAQRKAEKKRYYQTPKGRAALAAHERRQIAGLHRQYLRRRLRSQGFPSAAITEELIELKRQQLDAKRLARQVRKAIANETITNNP